jgi:hypothetical protein
VRRAAALLALLLVTGCGDGGGDGRADQEGADGRGGTVGLAVDGFQVEGSALVLAVACSEGAVAVTEESVDQVIVTVSGTPVDGGCSSEVRVELAEPLGERQVVDAAGQRRFTAAGDELAFCGLEVLDCDLTDDVVDVAAACASASYRHAIATEVDGGSLPFSNERCDGSWLALDVDFGASACPPEDDSCRGVRVHRVFFRNDGGRWVVLSYQGSGDCAEAQAADPAFPEAVCGQG